MESGLLQNEIAIFRSKWSITDKVVLTESDNELLMDFTNEASVRLLIDTIGSRKHFVRNLLNQAISSATKTEYWLISLSLVQLVDFIKSFQEAKLSIERIQAINRVKSEDAYVYNTGPISQDNISESDIILNNVDFRYSEVNPEKMSLTNINLILKSKKITAIVGASGSGKTTLAKVLLRFYQPTHGNIHIGDIDINSIPFRTWREICGTVLQDGYIFNDTIANNISVGQSDGDIEAVSHAARIACIADFIESLPLKYSTKIGSNGIGLSSGQKQRILIARAIFKKPKILFLDEATSALDAVTEKKIVKNLKEFFTDRTVIIIAHRLSTVRYADNIVVMDDGKIVEIGEHDALLNKGSGAYVTLVHSQM